ncbi:MAG TPA: phosphatase PAP2 family protein [Candidatus Nanoarchaeia archaeon]|nr:phosphatase PAP2 family protein [Candidatus Nanoarchaeia archaeon]
MSLQSSMILWRQLFWKIITVIGSFYVVVPVAIGFLLANTLLGVKLLLGIAVISAITIAIRLVYFKERPKKRPTTNLLRKIDASSFPSIHAARGFFFAMTITRAYQNPTAGIVLFVLAVLIAFSRYRLHHHDTVDILGGTILGIAMNYLVELEWIMNFIGVK